MSPLPKYLLFAWLPFLFVSTARADLGSTLVYHTILQMQSGERVTCYLIIGGYEAYDQLENGRNAYCNDAGIIKILRAYQAQKQHLTGYKQIYYPKSYRLPDSSQLSMALTTDTFPVVIGEVKSARFLDVENWRSDLPGIESLRYATPEVLALAQHGACRSRTWFSTNDDALSTSFCLLNYNAAYNAAEIERLYQTYWEKKLTIYDPSGEKYWKVRNGKRYKDSKQETQEYKDHNRNVAAMQQWFEARNVLLVFDYGT